MVQTNSRVLFVVDRQAHGADQTLTRDLILAQALADLGCASAMVAAPETLVRLQALAPEMTRAVAASESADDIGQALARLEFDAVVFDHPGLSQEDHIAMAKARPSVVIDDLCDRPIGGQIIVNSALTRLPSDYAGLCLAGAEVLTGPQAVFIGVEFAKLRAQGRAPTRALGRVMLTLGDEAPEAVITEIVDHLRPRLGEASLDVVLPQGFENFRGLVRMASRDPRLTLLDTPSQRALIAARADLAITGLGSSLWEASALGLPIIAIVLGRPDQGPAQRLTELEAAICLDAHDPAFHARLERAFVRLGADPEFRQRLGDKSATLTDGSGAQLVAQKLIALSPG